MSSPKKILSVNELRAGMISSMDINFEDKILLAKDVIITDSIISKLKATYIIHEVEVYLDENSSNALTVKSKTVEELEDTFNEFSSSLEFMFNSLATLRVPDISEIRIFSQRIREEFNATGIVLKNIVFYGSGNDKIYRHSINVAAISFILGKWAGLDEHELTLLNYAALLHDFGKTQISKDILYKKDTLTSKEIEIYNTHPIIGYNFVKQIPYTAPSISQAVLMHHERMDGSGYPLHLKQDKIPDFAKIIAIADLFDEVSSNNYSEKIKGPLESLQVIQEESITKLDYHYSNIFLNHILDFYMGENVMLNDERTCKIIQLQMNELTKPLLLYETGFIDLKKERDLYVAKLII